MNLDTYTDPDTLYLARGGEVNPNRPVFTGDVFLDVAIPGVQDGGMAQVIAHPCSFRQGGGELKERILMASVTAIPKQGANAWCRGLFDRMPLPDLLGDGYWASHLSAMGQASLQDLPDGDRTACLSEVGINMLQQRLTCHLTRAEIPTQLFHQAFSHTLEEADLLEEWIDELTGAGWTRPKAIESFEIFVTAGSPTIRSDLLDPQRRAQARAACRKQIARMQTEGHASASWPV